jgi:hypothetical protein
MAGCLSLGLSPHQTEKPELQQTRKRSDEEFEIRNFIKVDIDGTISSQLGDVLYLRKFINIAAIIYRVVIPHIARRQEACRMGKAKSNLLTWNGRCVHLQHA